MTEFTGGVTAANKAPPPLFMVNMVDDSPSILKRTRKVNHFASVCRIEKNLFDDSDSIHYFDSEISSCD
jgi:hypothetical protein